MSRRRRTSRSQWEYAIRRHPWMTVAAFTAGAHVVLHFAAYGLLQLIRTDNIITIAGVAPEVWMQLLEMVGTVTVGLLAARAVLTKHLVCAAFPTPAVAQPPPAADALASWHGRPAGDLIKELSLLYEIGQGVSRTIELPALLSQITELLEQRLHMREFAVLLLDEAKKTLRVRASAGFLDRDTVQTQEFRLGEGISGTVAQTGVMEYVKDTRRDPRCLHYRGAIPREGSLLSIPLRYQQHILGVINFGRAGANSFAQNEIRVFGLVANQIALAIANAKLYDQTRALAIKDDLTGLYNRRYFVQTMQAEWKRSQRFDRPMTVLMVDVDHYKSYNDTYGHLHGDQILCRLADLLRSSLREVDTVARFGGEEFVVLLPDTDRLGGMHVAEKLRRLVESTHFPVPEGQTGRQVTVSIGVATYPDDARQVEDLIDHADIALYEAKDQGRNRVVGYPVMPMLTPVRETPRIAQ